MCTGSPSTSTTTSLTGPASSAKNSCVHRSVRLSVVAAVVKRTRTPLALAVIARRISPFGGSAPTCSAAGAGADAATVVEVEMTLQQHLGVSEAHDLADAGAGRDEGVVTMRSSRSGP
jgi:hypothetical protein